MFVGSSNGLRQRITEASVKHFSTTDGIDTLPPIYFPHVLVDSLFFRLTVNWYWHMGMLLLPFHTTGLFQVCFCDDTLE